MFHVCLGTISMLMLYQRFTDCTELPENTCQASLKTITYVKKCPTNTKEYIAAARQKECSRYNNTCISFEYHCVLNELMTSLVEVCAPSRYILSGKCTEFNKECQCIRKSYVADCTQFSKPCPEAYNSTKSFLYSQCHRMISTTADRMPNTTTKVMENTKQTFQKVTDTPNILKIVIPVAVACPLLVTIILIAFFIIRQKKKKGCNNTPSRKSIEDVKTCFNTLPGEVNMPLKENTDNTDSKVDLN